VQRDSELHADCKNLDRIIRCDKTAFVLRGSQGKQIYVYFNSIKSATSSVVYKYKSIHNAPHPEFSRILQDFKKVK